MTTTPPSAKERIQYAQLLGAAKRVRGCIWQADEAALARQAEDQPRLWEALRALVELVDEQAPPFGHLDPARRSR